MSGARRERWTARCATTYGMTLVEYEQRWRQRTRRRYGALALVSDVTSGRADPDRRGVPAVCGAASARQAADGGAGRGGRGGRTGGPGERDRGAVARGRLAGFWGWIAAAAAILITP